jgi:hypothetical protein
MSALSNTLIYWLGNRRLQLQSPAACGLWLRILFLLDTNERRGFLQVNGSPMSIPQLGLLTSCPADEASRLLKELLAAGIACLTDAGCIHCRILLTEIYKEEEQANEEAERAEQEARRAEQKRRLCAEAGRRGGRPPGSEMGEKGSGKGDPFSGKGSGKGDPFSEQESRENASFLKAEPAEPPGARVLGLSSDSSEEEKKKNTKEGGAGEGRKKSVPLPPIPASLDTPDFRAAWARWLRHRREKRATLNPTTADSQLRTFEKWGEARAIAAIENSIFRGWTGLFESKSDQPNLFSSIEMWAKGDEDKTP